MANKAFRLFRFTPYINKSYTAAGLAKKVGTNGSLEYVCDWLDRNLHHIFIDKTGTNIDIPVILSNRAKKIPAKKGDPCFYVDSYSSIFDDVIEVVLYKGSFGDLDTLVRSNVGNSSAAQDIKDDAATRKFLVRIGFSLKSSECYAAAELRYNTQACTDLFNRISYESQIEACSQVKSTDWYNWRALPLVDGDRFQEAASNAEITKINLVKNFIGPNGVPTGNKATFAITDLTIQQQRGLLKVLFGWAKWFSQNRSNTSKPGGTKEVAGFFPAGYIKASDWDTGEITFKENGKETTISATKLKDLVVYPLGDKASEEDMWKAADKALYTLAVAEKWNIPRLI